MNNSTSVKLNIVLSILCGVMAIIVIPVIVSNIMLRAKNKALKNREPDIVTEVEYKDTEETLARIQSCEKANNTLEKESKSLKDSNKSLQKQVGSLEEDLDTYKTAASFLSEGYITMFDIAETSANYFGQPIHQDWYDLYTVALGFL